jgi:hypothetical protein
MKLRLSDLTTWCGTLDRGPYVLWALLLCALKYNLDRFLVWRWTGQRWSLLDYTKFGEYLWPKLPSFDNTTELAGMLGLAAPFMAAGVILTAKRLRSARLHPALVFLFFVPVVKFLLFALLSVAPEREGVAVEPEPDSTFKTRLGFFIPRNAFGSAVVGVLITAALCALGVWMGASLLRGYGWSLFVGVPFALGFLSVLVFGYHAPRSFWNCMWVSVIATFAAACGLLLVAIEGAICIVMAAPLAVPTALIGACAAYNIQASDWWHSRPTRVLCIAAVVPLLMAVEHSQPPELPLLSVRSSVVVAAPPERVWRNVVSFAELPPPHETLFRLGIAYPIRARIFGNGVGAERHCEFSTGPFIEPIEVWDEPRLLKFAVTKNPEPMQEWTPYRDVHPAHLNGFLESRAGQFRLERLPDGKTLLEGTTWYYHHMWPASYWQLWSDYIIHKIHLRVLRHVKYLSEHA